MSSGFNILDMFEIIRLVHKAMKHFGGSDYVTKDGVVYNTEDVLTSKGTGFRYHFRPPYSSEAWLDF
jgi:hypothetical protein